GGKVNIPSYLVEPGDLVAVRSSSRRKVPFQAVAQDLEHRPAPEWLSRDEETMTGRVLSLPERKDLDVTLNEQLIVEYYSR
ncbi:MAG: 30S ribosomal protein S4, partial [Anaerolineae bacterium]